MDEARWVANVFLVSNFRGYLLLLSEQDNRWSRVVQTPEIRIIITCYNLGVAFVFILIIQTNLVFICS